MGKRQRMARLFQQCAAGFIVRHVLLYQRVELRRMVHMPQMRKLMDDDIVYRLGGYCMSRNENDIRRLLLQLPKRVLAPVIVMPAGRSPIRPP